MGMDLAFLALRIASPLGTDRESAAAHQDFSELQLMRTHHRVPVRRRLFWLLNSSDGRVVRASSSGAVDSGLIPSRVTPMTLKLTFTASLLEAQH